MLTLTAADVPARALSRHPLPPHTHFIVDVSRVQANISVCPFLNLNIYAPTVTLEHHIYSVMFNLR